MYKTNLKTETITEVFNLKKIIAFFILYFLFWFGSAKADLPYLVPNCPNTNTFAETSINNKNELLMKLNEIVPIAYPDKMYKEWNVLEIEPLINYDKEYYKMVKKLCNKEVAENSWLVELEFPKFLPSASASTGIMFVVKDKEKGWYVWYTYR